MIFGFNTDVAGKDGVYHVQTEDRGEKHPVVDTIIYVKGKIVHRQQTKYAPGELSKTDIEEMVRRQHKEWVETIRAGQFASQSQSEQAPEAPWDPIQLLNPSDLFKNGMLQFEICVHDARRQLAGPEVVIDARWFDGSSTSQTQEVRLGEDGTALIQFPPPANTSEAILLLCATGPDSRSFAQFRVADQTL
ncbi:MAG: hypothetical protein A3F68_08320 [Acidobacteria bacterium RIFCSPLOWO2_12_FULL_54_10]|nr:MAG: hypothetical protein A3F68_08320 [Acidobacteria bacterium RIFCSPLOWO2_12_FULL_54_10]